QKLPELWVPCDFERQPLGRQLNHGWLEQSRAQHRPRLAFRRQVGRESVPEQQLPRYFNFAFRARWIQDDHRFMDAPYRAELLRPEIHSEQRGPTFGVFLER